MSIRPLGLGLALALLGCAGSDEGFVSPDEVTATERNNTRRRVIADGVEVRATRWDRALVEIAAETMPGSAETKAQARARWMTRYAAGLSFTVVVDIALRRPDPMRESPTISDPKDWHFSLGDKSVSPRRVDLVAIDRFPTEGGGHHERLVFEVHFGDRTTTEDVELFVRCDAPTGWRKALGHIVARRGVRLSWG